MTEAYAEQMTQAQSIKGIPTLLDSAKKLLVRSCWTVQKVTGTVIFMLDRAVHPLQLELLLHTGLARMRYSQESVYE